MTEGVHYPLVTHIALPTLPITEELYDIISQALNADNPIVVRGSAAAGAGTKA